MRDAGTLQGVRHEILSVGRSCITEARNIQRWPYRQSAPGQCGHRELSRLAVNWGRRADHVEPCWG
jgi:hypothetical protein